MGTSRDSNTIRPDIAERPLDETVRAAAVGAGMTPRAADILARRVTDPAGVATVRPVGKHLPHPNQLADMAKAAERLAQAIICGQRIAILSDYDCDGTGAAAVLRHTLCSHFRHAPDQVCVVIGRRLEDGYGVSDPVVDRVLAMNPVPALVITADCGSGDAARIQRLSERRVDVVVTDHHAIAHDGLPPSAYAVVNPQRPDSEYPDQSICGGTVAWLLCCATRQVLIQWGYLEPHARRIDDVFGYLALSTIADCVSIAPDSPTNRRLVQAGLSEIQAGRRACWRALKRRFLREGQTVDEQTIAFGFGPAINARSRVVSDAYLGVNLLLSTSDEEADALLAQLCEANEQRKIIQKSLLRDAERQASDRVAAKFASIIILQADGHVGVQGIVASRLTDHFGRPSGVFAPKPTDPDLVAGSLRSAHGLDLKRILDQVAADEPGLFVSMGGHAAAAGATLRRSDFERFHSAFERVVRGLVDPRKLRPIIEHDGSLEPAEFQLSTVREIEALAPFGRQFPEPQFRGLFQVLDTRRIGADRSHLKLVLSPGDGQRVEAVWFGAAGEDGAPVNPGDALDAVFVLSSNTYRGRVSVQCRIVHGVRRTSATSRGRAVA